MNSPATRRSRFLWGLLLTWVPFAFLCRGLFVAFGGVSSQKATGLGAVAGGLSEALVLFGLVALIASQAIAIMLLVRELSTGKPARTIVAVVSIGCSAFLLLLAGGFVFLLVRLYGRLTTSN